MWSNTSKIGFAMIYDTFRTWGFSPVLFLRPRRPRSRAPAPRGRDQDSQSPLATEDPSSTFSVLRRGQCEMRESLTGSCRALTDAICPNPTKRGWGLGVRLPRQFGEKTKLAYCGGTARTEDRMRSQDSEMKQQSTAAGQAGRPRQR